jgi:arabinose-5-phosphate isomerase
MTRSPKTTPAGSLLSEACDLLADKKISELPVVDSSGQPLGMLDITDLVGLHPDVATAAPLTGPAILKLVLPQG